MTYLGSPSRYSLELWTEAVEKSVIKSFSRGDLMITHSTFFNIFTCFWYCIVC